MLLALLGIAVAPTSARATAPGWWLTPLAGLGHDAYAGDGGSAVAAGLAGPADLLVLPDGSVLIADSRNDAVRRISPDGRIATVAGRSTTTNLDAATAADGALGQPTGIGLAADGALLIADTGHDVVQRLDATGRLTVLAGHGLAHGPLGDGGPALRADLAKPTDVAGLPDGGFLVVDQGHQRVRRVDANGMIMTVAGNGVSGDRGDGGPAVEASLRLPRAVATQVNGGFIIADTGNHLVRAVAADGTIRTIAGTRTAGFGGDGGRATSAMLDTPLGVAIADDGILIADSGNHRVRRVTASGVITTIAGNGSSLSAPTGGPALDTPLGTPAAVVARRPDELLIADGAGSLLHRLIPSAITPHSQCATRVTGLRHTVRAGTQLRLRLNVRTACRVAIAIRRSSRSRFRRICHRLVPGHAQALVVRMPKRPGGYQVVVLERHGNERENNGPGGSP